ncbi:MAG: LacI family DNA-binding transcriptional regulator [Syntrophomonadaceae bacterium]
MKNKTIVDIAKELQISPSTVSRALNDHPYINKETKLLVKKVARQMGYMPNPIARGLRQNRTTSIGVIVPEIKHDFFSSAISGIEEVAYRSGYTIIVCQSNESYEREVLNTKAMILHRVAGLIACISQTTINGKHFNEVLERNIPLVFFDRVCPDVPASKIIIDDRKSAFNAVDHLIKRGYSKIAHFAGPKALDICSNRFSGYKEALEKSNISVDENLICFGGLHEEDGYKSMDKLLRNKTDIDAVFAVNDPVAIGAFQRIKEAGLRIPEDLGIVGFSNNTITTIVDPPLTTVNQPSMNMGKRAAEIIIGLINDKTSSLKPFTEVLEADLIIRGSS